jgi:hypothetical protein
VLLGKVDSEQVFDIGAEIKPAGASKKPRAPSSVSKMRVGPESTTSRRRKAAKFLAGGVQDPLLVSGSPYPSSAKEPIAGGSNEYAGTSTEDLDQVRPL